MKKFFSLIVFFCFLGGIALASPLDDGNPVVLCPGPCPVLQLPPQFQPKSWNLEVEGQMVPSFVCNGKAGFYFFSTTRSLPAGIRFNIAFAGNGEIVGDGIIGPMPGLPMSEFRWYSLFERGKSAILPLDGQCGLGANTGVNAYCQEGETVSFRLVELGSGREFKAENALKFQLPSGQWAACMSPLLGDGKSGSFFLPGQTYRVECRKPSGNLTWYFSTVDAPAPPAPEKI